MSNFWILFIWSIINNRSYIKIVMIKVDYWIKINITSVYIWWGKILWFLYNRIAGLQLEMQFSSSSSSICLFWGTIGIAQGGIQCTVCIAQAKYSRATFTFVQGTMSCKEKYSVTSLRENVAFSIFSLKYVPFRFR